MEKYIRLSEDKPSAYIADRMFKMLSAPLLLSKCTVEVDRADNAWRIKKTLRKNSWVVKCIEWDEVYNANRKGKTLRVMGVKELRLQSEPTI